MRRLLVRSPAFTAIAVLSLSLGSRRRGGGIQRGRCRALPPLAVDDPGSLRDFRVSLTFGSGSSRKDVFRRGPEPGESAA